MTDKTAEHAQVLFLLFCGLLLIRIFSEPEFRQRYLAVFHIDVVSTREIVCLAILTTVTMVAMPTVDLTTIWLDFADFKFIDGLAYGGVAIGIFAIAVLWRAQYDWLKFFRRTDTRQRSFIRIGIYQFIRHPFYAALLLLAVAQMLMLQNWIAGPAALITFLIVYLVRVPVDEQRAMEFYGHSYLDYMDRTNSLLPQLFSARDER